MSPERTAAHAARDLALLVFGLLRGGRLVSVTVRGASMLPVYQDGDRVLVRRGPTPRRGTVVVAERPDPDGRWPLPVLTGPAHAQALADREWVIKRVAALPGDSLPLGEVPALAAPETAGTPACPAYWARFSERCPGSLSPPPRSADQPMYARMKEAGYDFPGDGYAFRAGEVAPRKRSAPRSCASTTRAARFWRSPVPGRIRPLTPGRRLTPGGWGPAARVRP
ncbi:S24/S26 family peptidase [Streptomyces smyrnaeus]|uniref:S24/S26 family peptidase n=1 Tax=Streptomyces smyrnaeus TaxID=1387713 RepID=UPI0036A8911E